MNKKKAAKQVKEKAVKINQIVQENFSDFWIDSIWKTWNWFFLVSSSFQLCSLIERTSEIT